MTVGPQVGDRKVADFFAEAGDYSTKGDGDYTVFVMNGISVERILGLPLEVSDSFLYELLLAFDKASIAIEEDGLGLVSQLEQLVGFANDLLVEV